jgi:hypothetical protein
MMGVFVSQGIKELCKSMIDNPHDWVQTGYKFVNIKHSDISIWTANGLSFIQINGNDGLSFCEKICVLRAIKLTIARRLNDPPKRA